MHVRPVARFSISNSSPGSSTDPARGEGLWELCKPPFSPVWSETKPQPQTHFYEFRAEKNASGGDVNIFKQRFQVPADGGFIRTQRTPLGLFVIECLLGRQENKFTGLYSTLKCFEHNFTTIDGRQAIFRGGGLTGSAPTECWEFFFTCKSKQCTVHSTAHKRLKDVATRCCPSKHFTDRTGREPLFTHILVK